MLILLTPHQSGPRRREVKNFDISFTLLTKILLDISDTFSTQYKKHELKKDELVLV